MGKFTYLFQKWWVPEPIAQKLMGSQEPMEPMLTEPLSISTVENFILDSAHPSLITIARHFITLQENVTKVIILQWSNGLDSCLWSCRPGFNSPAGSFTCFLQIFKISQTLRAYSRFQRTIGNLRLFQSKVEVWNYPKTISKIPARPGTSMKIILENQVFRRLAA